MAHTRIVDKSARIIDQCARGRFVRNVASVSLSIADARTNDTEPNRVIADVVASGFCRKGIFIAPSDAKIESISLIGSPYPMSVATSAAVWVQFFKATTSGDIAILSDNTGKGLQITGVVSAAATSGNGPLYIARGVVTDGSIYTTSTQQYLNAGEAVYVTVSANTIAIGSAAGFVVASVEWVPNDKSYAGS